MKHLMDFNTFNESYVNEGILGSVLAAAKGAFKNFLNTLSAPFKTLGEDFKKGMKAEDAKAKITKVLDTVSKSAIDSINKAEDEMTINQIKDQFAKEIDDKMAEFDKEIASVKESLLLEGIKDSMIGGRVLLGMLKDTIAAKKKEFDVKFASAKDLAGKKQAAIDGIKSIVNEYKTKIQNNDAIKKAGLEYKKENNIKSNNPYKVGDNVKYKMDGYDDAIKEEDQKDKVGEKEILNITDDTFTFKTDAGKEFKKTLDQIIGKVGVEDAVDVQNDIAKKIADIKDIETKNSIDKFVDFANKPENKSKLEDINKILNGE